MEGRWPFEVVPIPGKGNGAVALRCLAAGTRVLEDGDPLVVLASDDVCGHCFTERDPLSPSASWSRCGRCRVARFCCGRCREAARRRHETFECAALQGSRDVDGDEVDDVACVVQVETARLSGDDRASGFDRLAQLPEPDLGRLERARRRAAAVLGPEASASLSLERVGRIVGAVAANAFGLDVPMREGEFNEDGERDVNYLGRAVYVSGSFFNHSCVPNVCRVRQGRRMVFLAARDILAGEELCICYVNVAKKDRSAVLLEQYGFVCACELCAALPGLGPSLPPRCERCNCASFTATGLCCMCDADAIFQRLADDDC